MMHYSRIMCIAIRIFKTEKLKQLTFTPNSIILTTILMEQTTTTTIQNNEWMKWNGMNENNNKFTAKIRFKWKFLDFLRLRVWNIYIVCIYALEFNFCTVKYEHCVAKYEKWLKIYITNTNELYSWKNVHINEIKQRRKKTNQKNTQICTPSMNQVTQSLVDRRFLLNL